MLRRFVTSITSSVIPFLLLLAVAISSASAQGNGNGNGNGNNIFGGIRIDAQGVVSPAFAAETTGRLDRKRLKAAADQSLPGALNRPSPLRKISLVRLEKACRKYAGKADHIPNELKYLAGLQRIDYLFVYPERGDIVIAGPADGFAPNRIGRMVGVSTGRAVLRLDDLAIALQTLQRGRTIGCSIDPIPANLAALQRFAAASSRSPTTPAGARQRYRQMARLLGMQKVRVFGVPADSHFGQTLVEADYRMKLISVGLEKSRVRGLPSYLSMITLKGNSVQRWWFTPLYDTFQKSADGNAFALSGQRTQLLSQEEVTDAAGRRSAAAFTRRSTQRFAKLFTEKFPKLADRSPVFAQLQNLFDLAIVAAVLKKEQLPRRVGWSMSLFLDPRKMNFRHGHAPRKVPSVVNFRRARRGVILGLVGGGVEMNPLRAIGQMKTTSSSRLKTTRSRAAAKTADSADRWWWD